MDVLLYLKSLMEAEIVFDLTQTSVDWKIRGSSLGQQLQERRSEQEGKTR